MKLFILLKRVYNRGTRRLMQIYSLIEAW